jgi:hypothetical protein
VIRKAEDSLPSSRKPFFSLRPLPPPIQNKKEEQEGEAKRIWSNIWETNEMEFQQQALQQQQAQQQANNGNNSDTKSNDSATSNNNFPVETKTFNPTRRKGTNDNKASTFNMNKYQAKLVGKHGGCPWRPANFQYARGIIG